MKSTENPDIWDVVQYESTKLETTHLLRRTTATSLPAVISLALIICFIAYEHTSLMLLLSWIICLLLSFGLRFYIAKEFDEALDQASFSSKKFLIRFRIGTISTGIIWAVGETLILVTGADFSYEHYVFLTFVAVGFFVGAMLALSVDWPAMVGSCIPSLVPLLWAFYEMGDRTALSTGGALALFLAYIYVTAIRHGRSLHENLYLRFKAVEDEKKVKQILNNSPIGACISDLEDDELIFYNVRYRDLLKGYVNSQQTLRSIMTKDDYLSVMKSLKSGGQVRDKLISLKSATPSQEDKWVLVSFTRYEHNRKPAVLSWYYDITGIKRVGEKTEFMAYHDPLTQLPNRELFHDRVTKSIQQAKRDNKQLAIMFIDLDGFKKINDEYGHHVGDEILKQAASSMQAVLREVDTIARLGGDEFGVVTLLTDGQDVISIAQKLRSAIDKNYLIEGQKHWLTASVGISIYPDNGTTEAELVQCADAAMYKVKREGRNDVRLYAEL